MHWYKLYLISKFCNDPDNVLDYSIVEDKVFYKNELIFTDLKFIESIGENEETIIDMYAKVVKPTRSIKAKLTLGEFK